MLLLLALHGAHAADKIRSLTKAVCGNANVLIVVQGHALADGRIVPVIDWVFAFDELPAAKAHMEASAMVGKIVVRMA